MAHKTCIITGGNRGIGAFLSRKFAENGYRILIGARTQSMLLESEEFEGLIKFKKTDVRFEADHQALARAALQWTGRLDVYINNAGFSKWCPVSSVDEEFWDEMIDTNLKGVFWGCKTAAQTLQPGGAIINISSLAGKRGSANNTVYCASKFGVNGITQSLAKELGPKGIRVNAVLPGLVETDMPKHFMTRDGRTWEEVVSNALPKYPLGRIGEPEDVAYCAVFLASDEAAWITGQLISVDGGLTCGLL